MKDFKGEIAETKNSVALIKLIKLGLSLTGDGRYGLRLKEHRITIDQMKQFGVRIDKALDREVRSHGGKHDLNLSQAYFDVICCGLAARHLEEFSPTLEKSAEIGSILVVRPPAQALAA